jgi:trk system potassium uptake protein TrkA
VNIIVVGCGKVGQSIITLLASQGHDVSVVSGDPEAFANLPNDFTGFSTFGNPIDLDVLSRAGIENCDVFVAVTSDDNVNLMAVQIAKNIYNVGKVFARVNDQQKNDVFRSFGIETICPTNLTADALIPLINDHEHVTTVNHNGRLFVIMTSAIEKEHIGLRVSEINDLLETNEVIAAIEHADKTVTKVAFSNPELKKGDKLILVKITV